MSAASFAYRDGRIVGAMVQGPDELRAINGDRRWFLGHRGRTLRLRKPAPGELEALGVTDAEVSGYSPTILVRKVRRGVRKRQVIYTSLPIDAPEPVLIAFMQLWDTAEAQGYRGELFNEDLRRAMGVGRARNH